MLPLMLAGAAVSGMGDADRATSTRNTMNTYLTVLRNALAARQGRNAQATSDLSALQPEHQRNLSSLISGMASTGNEVAGRGASAAQMSGAVQQAQGATAGHGLDMSGGNTGVQQVTREATVHGADRTGLLVNALAAARGQRAGEIGQQGEMGSFVNAEDSLAQKIQDIMMRLARVNAVDQEQGALRDVSGAQSMRHASGVGRQSNEIGGYMNLAGAAYGGMGPGTGYGSMLGSLMSPYSNSTTPSDRPAGPSRYP